MNKYLELVFVTLMAILCHITSFAQNDSLTKDGLTYARAYSPNQFAIQFVQKKEQPRYVDFIKLEAEYDTVTMGLMAHAETKELLVGVYEFEVVEQPLIVNSGEVVLIDEQNEFDIRHKIEENIATKWKFSDLALCDSPANDCDLFEWMEVPVEQVEKSKDNGKSLAKDNQLQTSVAILKIKIPGKEEIIPVEYRFYTKSIKVKSAKNEIVEIPALYKTIVEKKPISSDLTKEWVEVMSPLKLNEYLISQIQLALKARNVYSNQIDGEWTEVTQAGLEHFQIQKGLHVGQLDRNTLEQLGFNFMMLRHHDNAIAVQ